MKNKYNLTELQIERLKAQRKKILINAAITSVGVLDFAALKLLSDTVGTDDMTIGDLFFLLFGGGTLFWGPTSLGMNIMDYRDMKRDFCVKSKKKIKLKK